MATSKRFGSEREMAAITSLSTDTKDFWVDHSVPILENCSSVSFLKNAYSRYHPVILRGGIIDNWKALHIWDRDYITKKLGEKRVSVNLTLNGRADSVQPLGENNSSVFVYPAESSMTIANFYKCMDNTEPDCPVAYLSQQNDNMRIEFPELLDDISLDIQLAADAFEAAEPEAVNLWIGDQRSVSSVHKDHYENFYAVISGEKTFTLLPPTDIAFMPESTFPTMRYHALNSESPWEKLILTQEGCPASSLSWIPLDPDDPDVKLKYPMFSLAHPIRCKLQPGDVLYIPAMWYHRVSQTKLTVSVNFWYDQRFDFRYAFYSTVQKLCGSQDDETGDSELI